MRMFSLYVLRLWLALVAWPQVLLLKLCASRRLADSRGAWRELLRGRSELTCACMTCVKL